MNGCGLSSWLVAVVALLSAACSLRGAVGDAAGDDSPTATDGAGDPAAGDPAAGDPAAGDPAAGDPAAGDPAAGDPAAGDPAAGDPAVGDPAVGDPAQGDPGGGDSGIPSGTVLFAETFEDTNWASRGWYDGSAGTITADEHAPASGHAFACTFALDAQGCSGGMPARHKFDETDRVYLSFWIKHSANWVGSGRAYHPHMFHFVTNADGDWVGPANSHLTTYIEAPTGRPFLGLQDSRNVDDACILRNNDTFVGCNGDFTTYPFTEQRSACACNGLHGFVDGRDCYDAGSYWYSSRSWNTDEVYFRDEAGPYAKTDWHFIEAYFELNSINGGIGLPDGRIRYWYDGELLIASDNILLRTGAHPSMRFNQFLFTPYIGDGSPVEQTVWIDDLTVATGRP